MNAGIIFITKYMGIGVVVGDAVGMWKFRFSKHVGKGNPFIFRILKAS